LKKDYFKKFEVHLLDSSNNPVKLSSELANKELMNNLILNSEGDLLAFYSADRVFIAKLTENELSSTSHLLNALELVLPSRGAEIDSIKWHPEIPTHIGVLSKNEFYIFCVSKTLDGKPEFQLNLGPKKPKYKIEIPSDLDPEKPKFIDFLFNTQDMLEDLRFLTVFFLNTHGEIFFYCPIFLSNMRIDEEEYQVLKEKIERKIKPQEGNDEESEDNETEFYYKSIWKAIESVPLKNNARNIEKIRGTEFEILNKSNCIRGYYDMDYLFP
jgi:hypothetical protein